jgi:meso-butanediol dehydrogenase / (S,S)-butanediol dehydrogenase / diacetyl reductase
MSYEETCELRAQLPMKEFDGRVAVVTGTTGIGRAIAIRLAAGGAQVVALGIEAAANKSLARDAARLDSKSDGSSLQVETCDVTNLDQVRSVITKTVSRLGGLGHHCQRRRDSSLWHCFGN